MEYHCCGFKIVQADTTTNALTYKSFLTSNQLLKIMPKKFSGENSKAVAARARIVATKNAAVTKIQEEAENAKWQDNDKNQIKRQQKKDIDEKRRLGQQRKKEESKALLDKEIDTISKGLKTTSIKVTRAQIQTNVQNSAAKKKCLKFEEESLEENTNRLKADQVSARNVTDAIDILQGNENAVDKHPERRMKAAYAAFEETYLRNLKLLYPSLRQSQLKEMVFKEWQKSPQNPMNRK